MRTRRKIGMQELQKLAFLLLMLSYVEGENLSHKQPTWQSNTLFNYTSDKAVDGLYSNRNIFGNQCAISGGTEREVTWMVDLGSIKSIHSVTISYRTDNIVWDYKSPFVDRFRGYKIFLHNRTKELGILYAKSSEFFVMDVDDITTKPAQARYVVYRNSRSGEPTTYYSQWAFLDLCEVIVEGCSLGYYGPSCSRSCPVNCRHCHVITGKCVGGCRNGYAGHQCKEYTRHNMALNRPTEAKTLFANYIKSRVVVDGKTSDPTFQGRSCLVTLNGQAYAEFRVDLQYIRSVELVRVYFRTDNATWDDKNGFTARPLGFSIIVSNTTFPLDGVVCFHEHTHTRSTIPAVFDADCRAVGRYVFYTNERVPGIHYPSGYGDYAFADICEVEVYGCPLAGYNGQDCSIPCFPMCEERYLENLALRKPTWQSSTWGGYTSDRAVDGNTDRYYLNGDCTVTPDIPKIVWWVNLETVRDIAYVLLYFRTDNGHFNSGNGLAGFPLGFSLYVSNTTDKDQGILCFHDTNFTRDTIPETLNITCPYKGQYVIYYNERIQGRTYPSDYYGYARADLCEVEVYGCPVPVENRPECFLQCPLNCQECHVHTGLCKKCYDTYEGDRCQYEKEIDFIDPCYSKSLTERIYYNLLP